MERSEGENKPAYWHLDDVERKRWLREFEAGYVFRKNMQFKPDTSLPWYEQVLDLERQGKPTSVSAHELAMNARRSQASGECVTNVTGDDNV